MILAYEIKEGQAVVWRCYDYGSEAELPETIEGCPVTELAPYAFSVHMEEGLLERGFQEGRLRLWEAYGGVSGGGGIPRDSQAHFVEVMQKLPPALTGTGLTAVSLPPALTKIGAYAFYNCGRLEKLKFYGALKDLGAGLFTGCHGIRKLFLTLDGDGTSSLREILIEVPEKLTVELFGSVRARLVFPEFFEESVENTPARILVIQTHGSGMNFRNCFYDRKVDFRAYDACFFRARAEEDFGTVLEMTKGRLMYPGELLPENRRMYEAWLLEQAPQAFARAVAERDMEGLAFLTELVQREPGKEALLKKAASQAAAGDFPEGTAFLMAAVRRARKTEAGSLEAQDTEGQNLKTGKMPRRFEL